MQCHMQLHAPAVAPVLTTTYPLLGSCALGSPHWVHWAGMGCTQHSKWPRIHVAHVCNLSNLHQSTAVAHRRYGTPCQVPIVILLDFLSVSCFCCPFCTPGGRMLAPICRLLSHTNPWAVHSNRLQPKSRMHVQWFPDGLFNSCDACHVFSWCCCYHHLHARCSSEDLRTEVWNGSLPSQTPAPPPPFSSHPLQGSMCSAAASTIHCTGVCKCCMATRLTRYAAGHAGWVRGQCSWTPFCTTQTAGQVRPSGGRWASTVYLHYMATVSGDNFSCSVTLAQMGTVRHTALK